ncbi:MAG: hypothetical protein H0U22_17140 [Geodermatophilaceae bacterium]|nr:hypothetical protein [Geodermatophilaceae bacterium]
MEMLTGRKLWPRITELCGVADAGSRLAAVAYVGRGAYDMLPMGAGNVLVADCTPASAAAGVTNPEEVRRFLTGGVDVFRWAGLHAKVFVFGDVAVVGSANASSHSMHHLDEAAVVITTRGGVRSVETFVSSLCVAPVDDDWLDRCARSWRPPRYVPRRTRTEHWAPIPPGDGWQLWCIRTEEVDWPQFADDALKQHSSALRATNPGPYRLDAIVWDARPSFRAGDVVIQRWTDGDGKTAAYPPALVEDVWVARRGKHSRTIITMMYQRGLRPIADSTLRRKASDAGYRFREVDAQRIKDHTARDAVLSLWPGLARPLSGEESGSAIAH